MKTCSGKLEKEKNFEEFLEKVSLSMFDSSLLDLNSEQNSSGYNYDASVNSNLLKRLRRLEAKKLIEKKLGEKGVTRKLSFLASEFFRYGRGHGQSSIQAIKGTEVELSAYEKAFETNSSNMSSKGDRLLRVYGEAKREAWNELKELISYGIHAHPSEIMEILDIFEEELLVELKRVGYIKEVERNFFGNRVIFSKSVEKLIARKVLELALRELEAGIVGDTESEKPGFFTPSFGLRDYDENIHTFDMIDIQESILSEFLATRELEIGNNAVVREFKRLENVVYLILIDSSDSMKGEKLRNAIKAALALREVAEERSRTLRIFSFNSSVRELREGEVVNLAAKGRTNIALALKKAADVAVEMDATPVVFLITDGEPTSPENPIGSAIKAAEMLDEIPDARLTVIMLSRDRKYADFCLALTEKVRKSSFAHLDPSNLTIFMLKCFY